MFKLLLLDLSVWQQALILFAQVGQIFQHIEPTWVRAGALGQQFGHRLVEGERGFSIMLGEGDGHDGFRGPLGIHTSLHSREAIAPFVGDFHREHDAFGDNNFAVGSRAPAFLAVRSVNARVIATVFPRIELPKFD